MLFYFWFTDYSARLFFPILAKSLFWLSWFINVVATIWSLYIVVLHCPLVFVKENIKSC